MPDDLYDDAGGEPAAAPEKGKDEGAATALLPKSFFPADKPLEVGNECCVTVEKVYGDQVSVSYSHSPEQPEEEEDMGTPTEPMSEEMA